MNEVATSPEEQEAPPSEDARDRERRAVKIDPDEVTLLEDRARVVRRATIPVWAGVTRLRIERVSPLIVDKTLAARVDQGEVRDVRITRRAVYQTHEREETLRALDEQIEETEDAVRRMERRAGRIESALSLRDEAGSVTLDELAQDAAWSRLDLEHAEARFDEMGQRERSLREERLGAQRALMERRRELGRLRARRQTVSQPSGEVRATLLLDLVREDKGEATVEIEYLVPNACWRPHHRAALDDDALRFECEGAVWQNTGEDWPDVQLRFSTQRPSLGAEPPALSTDRLRVQRKSETLEVSQREQVIETTGLGRQSQVAPELPGIDDGGDVMELRATHRAIVPSDGRPHRVALFAFEAPAEAWLWCAPELAPAVLLKTAHVNASPHAILAGPVDLVKSGGLVGRTKVLYVAPDERFELGWGPDPMLRVHREVEEGKPDKSLLRNWVGVVKTIDLKLSNLGPEVKHIELVERVPVSEIEKVKIEVDAEETHEGRLPDADGFVRWLVELDPMGRQAIRLRYTLRRHGDVVGI